MLDSGHWRCKVVHLGLLYLESLVGLTLIGGLRGVSDLILLLESLSLGLLVRIEPAVEVHVAWVGS